MKRMILLSLLWCCTVGCAPTDSRKDGNPDPPGKAGLARVAQR